MSDFLHPSLRRRKPLRRSTKPIPRYKRLRPISNKPHKVAIRKKDKAFQEDLPKGARCLVGKGCKGPLGKHHVVGRRHLKLRHDDDNAWILCQHHHLFDLHIVGVKKFCAKYGIGLPSPELA